MVTIQEALDRQRKRRHNSLIVAGAERAAGAGGGGRGPHDASLKVHVQQSNDQMTQSM